MGDYAKAEPLLQEALEIRRRVLGSQHPDTAQSSNNLAELYEAMGDYAKAEPLYEALWAPIGQALASQTCCFRRPVHGSETDRVIFQDQCHVGMLQAQRLLRDLQRALEKWLDLPTPQARDCRLRFGADRKIISARLYS
jgi:tetratricopeptide (TPR) repeat protein